MSLPLFTIGRSTNCKTFGKKILTITKIAVTTSVVLKAANIEIGFIFPLIERNIALGNIYSRGNSIVKKRNAPMNNPTIKSRIFRTVSIDLFC